jgi:sulfur transfer protein SufE
MNIESILKLDEADQYSYIINLGDELPPFNQEAKIATNRLNGCVTRTWIYKENNITHAFSDSRTINGVIVIILKLREKRYDKEQIINFINQLNVRNITGLSELIDNLLA